MLSSLSLSRQSVLKFPSGVSWDMGLRNPEQFFTASEEDRLPSQEGPPAMASQRHLEASEARAGILNTHRRTQEEINGDLLAGNLSPTGVIHLIISKSVSLAVSNIAHKFSDKISLILL